MNYSDIKTLAFQLDLNNYKEDSDKFDTLMKQLHPNGCKLQEETYVIGEYYYLKVPLIVHEFINEMIMKYNDIDLAHALFYRFANLNISRN